VPDEVRRRALRRRTLRLRAKPGPGNRYETCPANALRGGDLRRPLLMSVRPALVQEANDVNWRYGAGDMIAEITGGERGNVGCDPGTEVAGLYFLHAWPSYPVRASARTRLPA
jgi:hypothetical protein